MIRRTNYLIKRKLQLKFVALFLALLLLKTALIAVLFVYISSNTVTTGYQDLVLKVQKTSTFFFISFVLIAAITLVGVGLIGMAMFIILSHRIAGPLFRLERSLKEMERGDLSMRISLRRADQLMELKDALNDFVVSLDSRLARIKGSVIEAQRLLHKKDDPEAASKLEKTLHSLKSEIEHFKLTSDRKE